MSEVLIWGYSFEKKFIVFYDFAVKNKGQKPHICL